MTDYNHRDLYLNQLIAFQGQEPVKVITGVRRCGKSTLMKLMIEHLKETGIPDGQIIYMNFESLSFGSMTYIDFYNYVKERILPGKCMYLFFDEPQIIDEWNRTVNSFRVDFNCDIYLTGSNARLLSGEYATYLSGRYIEIRMLPLSFKEFIDFQGYTLQDYKTPMGGLKKRAYSKNGEMTEIRDIFEAYVRYGGFPVLKDIGLEQDKVLTVLDGIYRTVLTRDILERSRLKDEPQVTDPVLLEKVSQFLADNIGSSISLNNISNSLVSQNMLIDRKRQGKPAVRTIANYADSLEKAYLFYPIKRFDIKGKEFLQTLGKYYIVDTGLRNYMLGYRGMDTGHQLENIVYFELLRRGFDPAVGKVGNKEIDFVAVKNEQKVYYQVTEEMLSEDTRNRELEPLRIVRDSYEKVVLTLDTNIRQTEDGIRIVSILDFLLAST